MILSAIAIGQTRVSGLLEGDDVMATKQAMIDCGAQITKQGDEWVIDGVGMGGLTNPEKPLDLGNAGTGVRLLMGLIAGQSLSATFIGDASLSKRPMRRITDPLKMGAHVQTMKMADCLLQSQVLRLLCLSITGQKLPLLKSNLPSLLGWLARKRQNHCHRTTYLARSY